MQIMTEERIFKEYVTDLLARFYGDNIPRYHDLITPQKKPTETAEDVIKRMKEKMRKL